MQGRCRLMAALLGGMAWCAQHGAAAQPAAPAAEQGAQMRFSIPAGPLDQALTGFAAASGIQLLYDSGLTHGRRSPGVSGALPPREALRRLLAGSGLEGQFTSPQAVMLRPAPQQGSAADGSLVLPEVNVTAGLQQRSWQPVRGYVADVAATATKTDTPILETPQSISVVTRDQMDDQQVQNVGQALRYTAGLEGEYLGAYGSNDEAYSRGFAMDYYLDGMRVLHNAGPGAGTQIESFNLERIEVLRGPSSVLYGAGSPAGIINLVSRRPSDQAGGEVRLQAGSYDRLLGGFTSTGPLNEDKTLLYRMTGVGWQGGTQVDGSRQQRLSISPALTWRPDDRTSWTIIGQYAYDPEGGLYSYIPASGTILPNPNGTLDLRRNYGDQNNYNNTRRQYGITSLFEHQFNDTWTVRQNFRYYHTRSVLDGYYPQFFADNQRDLLGVYTRRGMEYDGYTADTHAQARFRTGPVNHTVVGGFDYQGASGENTWYFDRTLYSCDVFTYNPCPPTGGPRYGNPVLRNTQSMNRYGLYLQDQIAWGGWRLLLGGRQDWADSTTRNLLNNTTTKMDDSAFTGRVGLLYAFDFGLSPYVSYAESFNPQSGTDAGGNPFKPTTGRQYELGVKYQPPGWNMLLTAAVYDLRQQNVLTPDPNNTLFSVQTGEIRSRGVDLEAKASLNRNINLLASYTYLDNTVTRANDGTQGKHPVLFSAHRASAWLDYGFLEGPAEGLRLGAGMRYLGPSWGDTANTLRVPSATLFDARISYDLGALGPSLQGLTAVVNATNLADKQYIRGCYTEGQCFVGLGRTIIGTLSYRW
jgi:iron complex outermembrane recepter protein